MFLRLEELLPFFKFTKTFAQKLSRILFEKEI